MSARTAAVGRGSRRAALLLVALVAVHVLAGCGEDDPAQPTLEGTDPGATDAAGASAGCAAATDVAAGTHRGSVDTGGETRGFVLSVPPEHDGRAPLPLVVNLHGFTSDAEEQMDYTELGERGRDAGVVVVAPEGSGFPSQWRLPGDDGADDDVVFIVDLLDHLESRLCLDRGRVFATGMSNGAAFAVVLGCELAPRLAGVAPVAGVNLVAPCPSGEPVRLLAFHGTDDDIVPFDGGPVLFGLARARPVREAVADWASRNRCDGEPDEARDGEILHVRHDGCADGAGVELYAVVGGGHTWPGARHVTGLGHVTDEIDATSLILRLVAEQSP